MTHVSVNAHSVPNSRRKKTSMFFPLHSPACMGHVCLNEYGEQLRKEGDQGGVWRKNRIQTKVHLFVSFLFYSLFLVSHQLVRSSLALSSRQPSFLTVKGFQLWPNTIYPLLLLPATRGFLPSPFDLTLFSSLHIPCLPSLDVIASVSGQCV